MGRCRRADPSRHPQRQDWPQRRAQLGDAPQSCIDLTLERVLLTMTDDVAFVSIHRHRSEFASFRIDLPTTNTDSETLLVLERHGELE